MSVPAGSVESRLLLSDQVLDSAPMGMALTTPDGRSLWANGSWRRLAGAGDDAGDLAMRDLLHPDDLVRDETMVADLLAGRIREAGTAQRWTTPDGRAVHVELSATLAVDANGEQIATGDPPTPIVVRQVSDITDRITAEILAEQARLDLLERNTELERSNQELAEFAYVISHDLSEPLRVISGHVQLLSRTYRGQLGDDADEWIAFAVDGCERLRALIDDLLVYSRAGRDEPRVEAIDTPSMVAEVLAGLGAVIADSGAEVDVGDLPTWHGDPSQLSQLLSNLLSNAVKFSRPDVAPVITVTGWDDPDTATIAVSDNGIGIPERHRDRVFRVFQRLHARTDYPGTGIGLAICRKIVVRHHGSIEIDGNESGGTTISVTLPTPPRGVPQ